MGNTVSWLAIAGKPLASALQDLKLFDSGVEVFPYGSALTGTTLPNGSCVILADEFWHPLVQEPAAARVSAGCLVTGCAESENTNTSLAFLYRDGRQLWQVSHILDEGDTHLDIEGGAPRAVQALREAADAARRRDGHDAYFAVPGALARQLCGFHHDDMRGLRFTRLDPLPAEPRVDPAEAQAQVVAALRAVLEAQGFSPKPGGYGVLDYRLSTPQEDLHCFLRGSQEDNGFHCDVFVSACNHYVAGFRQFTPGIEGPLTCKLWLSDSVNGQRRTLASQADVDGYTAMLGERLPALLRQMTTFRGLDALANDGKTRFDFHGRPTLSQWDLDTGYSRIILAWLAGNPAFERMVADTDAHRTGGPDPENDLHKLAAHLRAHVKPAP